MARILSVDLGTTLSAAAIEENSRIEIFALGTRSPTIPTAVWLRHDGTMLVGDVAERRGLSEPTRFARELKRRLGDPVPIVIGGTPYGAETLMAHVLRWILDRVTEESGSVPERVVMTHPANYGPFKLDLLEQVARLAGIESVELLAEPEAAAVHYVEQERIEPGEVVAVYDLGGGTFDAALVQRIDDRFELVGEPDGMDRFGGVDLDEAVFSHVRAALGHAFDEMDHDDPAVVTALLRLREDCRVVKESLSSDTEGVVAVMLPDVHTEVRLTRAEFEDMARPRLRDTLTTMDRVVASADLSWADVARVLLVGGSSRIPLVGEMVQSHTQRPTALDSNPKYAFALGAAEAASAGITTMPQRLSDAGTARAEPEPSPQPERETTPESRPATASKPQVEPGRPSTMEPTTLRRGISGRSLAMLAGIVALMAVVGLAIGLGGNGDGAAPEVGNAQPAPADASEGESPDPDDPPVDGIVRGSDRVLAVYLADYADDEISGSWGSWAAMPDASPPADISSDYFPLLGPYDSTNPGVIHQHMAWMQHAGIGGIVVPWRGPDSIAARSAPLLLEIGAEYGVRSAFVIEMESGGPEEFLARAEEILDLHAFHPNYLRTEVADRDNRTYPRAMLVLSPPDGADPALWREAVDTVRTLAEGTVVLVIGSEAPWMESGADGLVGGPVDDGRYEWAATIGDDVWYVPTVQPGASAERVREPFYEDRGAGELFRRRWDEALAPRVPTFVIVDSFNHWLVGTQIEPALDIIADLPEREGVPYRTYDPLAAEGYIQLTRQVVDAFKG